VQEVGVLGGVDVVRHHRDRDLLAQGPAERRHQRGLARSDRSADADPEWTAVAHQVLMRVGCVVQIVGVDQAHRSSGRRAASSALPSGALRSGALRSVG
jgi:hypothetical protein